MFNLLACSKFTPYAAEGAPEPVLQQPQAIANWFALEEGKHDGILPPLAKAHLLGSPEACLSF